MEHYTVEALVSGHPRDAIKMSVTGAGRLQEWFSKAATRGVGIDGRLRGLAQLTINIGIQKNTEVSNKHRNMVL